MVDDAASAEGRALSRRAVLVGAAGLVGLVTTTVTGCSLDRTVTRGGGRDDPAGLAPDVGVATRALAEIRAVAHAVQSTVTRFPATRGELAALSALHRTHVASLVDAVPERATASPSPTPSPTVSPTPPTASPTPSPTSGAPAGATTSPTAAPTTYAVPRSRARAVPALVAREQELHTRLDALALEAESGEFARLLASMGAAVGQRIVGLAG